MPPLGALLLVSQAMDNAAARRTLEFSRAAAPPRQVPASVDLWVSCKMRRHAWAVLQRASTRCRTGGN